jgi:hypothetical protein
VTSMFSSSCSSSRTEKPEEGEDDTEDSDGVASPGGGNGKIPHWAARARAAAEGPAGSESKQKCVSFTFAERRRKRKKERILQRGEGDFMLVGTRVSRDSSRRIGRLQRGVRDVEPHGRRGGEGKAAGQAAL